MSIPDEASEWTRACAGDERAFASLFDRHYDRVHRHVSGITEQPADADEVAAATFVALWKLRSRVRVVGGSVLPWLLITATNMARNHGRRAQRYRRVLARMPRDREIVDASVIVGQQDVARRRAGALGSALDRLPVKDAQLIALTAFDEMPISEAAAALGITPGAARVRLHRARLKLRGLIDLSDETLLREETR